MSLEGRVQGRTVCLRRCSVRSVELAEGGIEVDGVDISKIGLADLRKGLAIIPQDATLVSARSVPVSHLLVLTSTVVLRDSSEQP